jgi:hypothetical protein
LDIRGVVAGLPDEELVRVTTPLGYDAILRKQNWEKHLPTHPEIREQLPNVALTLTDPDFLTNDGLGGHHYHRHGFGWGSTEKCYLYLVARQFEIDEPGTRTITTVFFRSAAVRGEVLWTRTSGPRTRN